MASNDYTEKIIISVGGSLIVDDKGINTEFLKNLNAFIRNQLANHSHRQFFLVVGGGAIARAYRDGGEEVIGHALTRDDLDWLGVHATRLNAQLVRTIFQDIAHAHIILDYDIIRKAGEPVVVAAGWKPGWSTDYDAVLLCEDYNAKTVINLTNVPQIYDADPKTNPNAKPIEKMTWEDLRGMIGDEWKPGMHAPFDPIAAKKAQELSVKVALMGSDFENISNYLEGKDFVGTVIS